jgi:hypothetical protein
MEFLLVLLVLLFHVGAGFRNIQRYPSIPLARVPRICHERIPSVAIRNCNLQESTFPGEKEASDAKPIVKFNIANALTLARVIAIPFFMLALVMKKVNSAPYLSYDHTPLFQLCNCTA